MASLTAPRHGSDDVVLYEGEVEKRGQVIRNWRPRYMVLWRNGPRLQYFMRDAAGAWAARDDISLANILFCKCASHVLF